MTFIMMLLIATTYLQTIKCQNDSSQKSPIDSKAFHNLFAETQEEKYILKEILHDEEKTVQVTFKGLYWGYKNLLSTQDAQSCSFHPSCSTFALDAVQEKGPLVGILLGFDRLTRCNSLSPENYPRHSETGRLHDPLH